MAEEERREASQRDEKDKLHISHPMLEGPQSLSLEGLKAVSNFSVEENNRGNRSHLFGGKIKKLKMISVVKGINVRH